MGRGRKAVFTQSKKRAGNKNRTRGMNMFVIDEQKKKQEKEAFLISGPVMEELKKIDPEALTALLLQ